LISCSHHLKWACLSSSFVLFFSAMSDNTIVTCRVVHVTKRLLPDHTAPHLRSHHRENLVFVSYLLFSAGSHSGSYEEYRLPGYNSVWSVDVFRMQEQKLCVN
jgi:hypothetical protein